MKKVRYSDSITCHFSSLEEFYKQKISNDENNNSYVEDGIVFFNDIPKIKWNQIVFIDKEKLIWTHGTFYGEKENLENFVTEDDFIGLESIVNTCIRKGSLSKLNGQSLEEGGNIELDLTLYKIVDKLPTENILDNKIYLVINNTSQTSTNQITDSFEKYIYINDENPHWEYLGHLNQTIDLFAYLTKADADKSYLKQSVNTSSKLSVSANGAFNNFGDNGQAFNAVRDLTGTSKYNTEVGSGFPINAASFGVKDNGTTAFSHKKYTTFNKDTGKYTGAQNTAVLTFSGKSGLMYAKNTGTANDVTDAMYKYIGVIDSPDDNQRVYSASQVDGITNALAQRIEDLESQNEYLMNVISVLMNKVGISPEELSADGTARQSLSDIEDDVNTNIINNTTDYSNRSDEQVDNLTDV